MLASHGVAKPKTILLRPWRTFDPSVRSATIVSGILARFHKYETKHILTGYYYPGDTLVCSTTDRRYPEQYRALVNSELQIFPELVEQSTEQLSLSHEQLLDSIIKRATLSSEDKILDFLSKFLLGTSNSTVEISLGSKAIASCSMLSVRQVSRVLSKLQEQGVVEHGNTITKVNRRAFTQLSSHLKGI